MSTINQAKEEIENEKSLVIFLIEFTVFVFISLFIIVGIDTFFSFNFFTSDPEGSKITFFGTLVWMALLVGLNLIYDYYNTKMPTIKSKIKVAITGLILYILILISIHKIANFLVNL